MMFKERFTEEIRNAEIKQKELAQKLNISESNITNWKKGDNAPSIEMLYNICRHLDVSADYLLGLEDEFGNKTDYNFEYNSNGTYLKHTEKRSK